MTGRGRANQGRVTGRVALVTGAGSGIGRTVALRLAEEGARVVVTSRTPEHVEEVQAEIQRACGRDVTAFTLDVSDPASIDHAVQRVAWEVGRIDILSNNAGIDLLHSPSLEETTDAEWARVLRVNLTGIFWTCRAPLPVMREGGAIVNMASTSSFVAWPNDAAYTASKGGLLQFTRALALEVAPRRIRANCVCPGVIEIPLTEASSSAPRIRRLRLTPMPRSRRSTAWERRSRWPTACSSSPRTRRRS